MAKAKINQVAKKASLTGGELIPLGIVGGTTAYTTDINDISKFAVETKNVTYSALKAMRDNGQLIAGVYYRITDYTCTTEQEDTNSAGHAFDIIVQADDERTLNENAKAAQHSGDTYFNTANLNAWELKYCIDNDINRFAWADSQNGKGVIYYMKDEWNNECPYDFKNIQFKRKITTDDGYPVYDEENGTDTWVYTFTATSHNLDSDEWSGIKDGSLESPYGHESDESSSTFHNNVIKEYIKFYDNDDEDHTRCGMRYLNNNVFLGYYEELGSDDEYYYAYCSYSNTFGINCYNNTFGNSCYSNTFINECYNNTFGNYCHNNTFGNDCNDNTFGNSCHGNTFGDGCNANTFGNYCHGNTFGNSCHGNTFGNSCHGNTFGNYCSYNTFASNSSGTAGNYFQYIKLENGASYNTIYNTSTASYSSQVQNYLIKSSVRGVSNSSRNLIQVERNRNYDTTIAKNSSGTLIQYCEEDLNTEDISYTTGCLPNKVYNVNVAAGGSKTITLTAPQGNYLCIYSIRVNVTGSGNAPSVSLSVEAGAVIKYMDNTPPYFAAGHTTELNIERKVVNSVATYYVVNVLF